MHTRTPAIAGRVGDATVQLFSRVQPRFAQLAHCPAIGHAALVAARPVSLVSVAAHCLPVQHHALPVQRHALPTQRHVLPLQRLSPERNLGSIEGAGAFASRHPVGCATRQMRSPRLAASSRRCARLPGNRVAASPRAAAPQMRPRLALPAHCSAIVHAALVAARSISLAAVTAQCTVGAAPLPRKLSRFNRGCRCARPPAPVGCSTSQMRLPRLAASSRRCTRLPGTRMAASPRAAVPWMQPHFLLH